MNVGRVFLSISIVGLGIVDIFSRAYLAGLEPVGTNDGNLTLSILCGAILIVLGTALLLPHVNTIAAVSLTAYFIAWLLVLHLPAFARHPGDSDEWTVAGETLGIAGALWLRTRWPRWLGRTLYGVSLFVFGTEHYMFHAAVAQMVPAWIPAPLVWAYLTGTAHFLGGVSAISGVLLRVAGPLLGAMFGSWVVLIYIASLPSDPSSFATWSNLFITLAMSGGGFLLSSKLRTAQRNQDTYAASGDDVRGPNIRARRAERSSR